MESLLFFSLIGAFFSCQPRRRPTLCCVKPCFCAFLSTVFALAARRTAPRAVSYVLCVSTLLVLLLVQLPLLAIISD